MVIKFTDEMEARMDARIESERLAELENPGVEQAQYDTAFTELIDEELPMEEYLNQEILRCEATIAGNRDILEEGIPHWFIGWLTPDTLLTTIRSTKNKLKQLKKELVSIPAS